MRLITLLSLSLLVINGCTTTARITNSPVDEAIPIDSTAISGRGENADNALFFISFSGGGTRAAALSYGVLEELRDATFTFGGKKKRLLRLSAVSKLFECRHSDLPIARQIVR